MTRHNIHTNYSYNLFKPLYKADWHFKCHECKEIIKVPFKDAAGGFYLWETTDQYSEEIALSKMFCSTECIEAVQKEWENRSGQTKFKEVVAQEPIQRTMTNNQAIGYLLLACKIGNQPTDYALWLANNMVYAMNQMSESEAEELGHAWANRKKQKDK